MNKVSLIALALIASPIAQAAGPTGSLGLSGTVAAVNEITVTPSGANTTLNITGGASNVNVASVLETSNNLLGYHITMLSTNGGELRHASDATKKTTYTISYDGGTAAAPGTSASTVKNVPALSGLTSDTSPVTINVTAYGTAPAGVYSDTITLAIVAN